MEQAMIFASGGVFSMEYFQEWLFGVSEACRRRIEQKDKRFLNYMQPQFLIKFQTIGFIALALEKELHLHPCIILTPP